MGSVEKPRGRAAVLSRRPEMCRRMKFSENQALRVVARFAIRNILVTSQHDLGKAVGSVPLEREA